MFRIILTLLVVGSACRPPEKQDESIGLVQLHPDSVPRSIALAGQQDSVLIVTLTATSAGYTARLRVGPGSYSQTIDTSRDVLIAAKDAAGGVIGATSTFNPRAIRTTGTRDPAEATLATARMTVSFRDPRRIRTIDLVVRRGPNAGYQATIAVPEGTVRVTAAAKDST